MARAKITYVYNSRTGKREWHIQYESPPDATMQEHESKHRDLVRKIVGSIEGEDIEVERGESGKKPKPTAAEEPLSQIPRRKPN